MNSQYPSNISDEQWSLTKHLFCPSRPFGGRPRPEWAARDQLNGILYVMKSGCQWEMLPKDFPPWKTVYSQKVRWSNDGTLQAAMAICTLASQQIRRESENPVPSVAILDSTFVESAYGCEGTDISGYKKAKGNCIHVAIDKHRDVLSISAQNARVSDSAAAVPLIEATVAQFPSIKKFLADGTYDKPTLHAVAAELGVVVDATSPPLPQGCNFNPIPLRWRVEQFFSWLAKWRRIAKNWCYSSAGFDQDLQWSVFGLTIRCLDILGVVG
jgi:putative transposase